MEVVREEWKINKDYDPRSKCAFYIFYGWYGTVRYDYSKVRKVIVLYATVWLRSDTIRYGTVKLQYGTVRYVTLREGSRLWR